MGRGGLMSVQCRVRAMQMRASIGLSIVMALVLVLLLPYLFAGLMTGALAKLRISHATAGGDFNAKGNAKAVALYRRFPVRSA